MISGLMNRQDFEQGINISNPFISRWNSITRIAAAVQNAHGIGGQPAQFIALLGIQKLCYDWKVEYKRKKKRSWRLSRRAAGIEALEGQITRLFQTRFSKEYSDFRASLNKKTRRAGRAFQNITGIGASGRPALRMPGSTRHLSSTEYVLEFLEPRHRANASQMKTLWDTSDSYLSFTEFVNRLDRDFVRKIDEMNGRAGGRYKWVYYLNAYERALMELKPTGAKNEFRRDRDQALFDTAGDESEPGRRGWAIFVMDESNRIYANAKTVKQFHHSSFLGGKPVKSAGTLKATKGRIVGITMASGHYAPGPRQALAVCRALLVKFSGNTGAEVDRQSHANSQRAQRLLSDILICPDFQNITFYNALEYVLAGGDTAGLAQSGPPQ